jgi:hypothetical protein
MKKLFCISVILFSFQQVLIAQCKTTTIRFPDGTMYYETESALLYQTSQKKLLEKLTTDKENYFLTLLPTPFLPKPDGMKVKADLQVVLSNGKTYTLSHFDSRYDKDDTEFELLFLIDKEQLVDFQKLQIVKILLDNTKKGAIWYNLKLHKDALNVQLACFLKKKEKDN